MKDEEKVLKNLVKAWNNFVRLKPTHPSHNRLFIDGIHQCQQVLMWRECQRNNPKKYPIYIKKLM